MTLYLCENTGFLMKKTLLTIILLLSFGIVYSQYNYYDAVQPQGLGYEKKNNTLYASFEPTSFGFGLRYDRAIYKRFQAYTSVSTFGNYNTPEGGYIKDYVKVAVGGMLNSPVMFEESYISFGLNYHHYGESYFPYPVKDIVLAPVSVEFGAGVKLEWVSVAFRMDILKWESSIDVGVNF